MLQEGIISPSKSENNFPLVIVRKRLDASNVPKIRICVDLRRLNDGTEDQFFPLPDINEVLCELANSDKFSVIDLASSFLQLELHPQSRHLCSFSTRTGKYEYVRAPYGLKNLPREFSRLMSIVLGNLGKIRIFSFIDDVIVVSQGLPKHLASLRALFQALR